MSRWGGPASPLRLRRMALGLRQVDLAKAAHISREQVSMLERRKCTPTYPTAVRLASALATRPEEIFPLDEEPQS